MTMDGALFGDEDEPGPPVQEQSAGLADWLVSQLRRALDSKGVTEMGDRQKIIEDLAGRPVGALRELTSSEARLLLEKLAESKAEGSNASGSSWDQRDEDTWIDRL